MNSNTIDNLIKAFKWHEWVRSILFSKVISFVIILPFMALTINMLLLYVRYVYPLMLILSFIISIYFTIAFAITLTTIKNYNEKIQINVFALTYKFGIPTSLFIFIFNALLIILFTPYFI